MNYLNQQKYFERGRIWAVVCVAALLAAALNFLRATSVSFSPAVIVFGLVALALAFSLIYTPDYLNLTANPRKRASWQIKIRWRVIGAVLIFGLLLAPRWHGTIAVLIAVAWLGSTNFLAKKTIPPYGGSYPAYFWATDIILICGLALSGQSGILLVAILVAATTHLAILACDSYPFAWAIGFTLLVSGFLETTALSAQMRRELLGMCVLVLASALTTAWLIHRAQKQNAKNVAAAMQELADFTGYPADKIMQLWATSNQQLARNWQAAQLDEKDAERMAAWYRENSELYLFAISGYNLEYKRIVSNLRMLRFGRGACLDYGAGNGELLLELARRGHRVVYYDVDGTTKQFALKRAARQKLNMKFLSSKEELAAEAKAQGFDTIFSFDVLEHLPDLPGELSFLASLLNPGGLMVFDVPAGSTKAHPMHLNHDLDVRAHLTGKGMQEKRSLSLGLPFLKQEKYAFQART